jgi:hypothetical protein
MANPNSATGYLADHVRRVGLFFYTVYQLAMPKEWAGRNVPQRPERHCATQHQCDDPSPRDEKTKMPATPSRMARTSCMSVSPQASGFRIDLVERSLRLRGADAVQIAVFQPSREDALGSNQRRCFSARPSARNTRLSAQLCSCCVLAFDNVAH